MNLIKYSEIFKSIQGEGKYTGVPTIWLRLFACNLNCDGFGQANPTDPSTYHLPYKDIDAKRITMIEDIPVLKTGCDSSYSWAAKFKHLQHEETADTIVDKLVNLVDTSKIHPSINVANSYHLCFTGGEPLLKANQKAVVDVLRSYKQNYPNNLPTDITFETNGTQLITPELLTELKDSNVLLSFSPKLFSVSGEPAKRALKADIIAANIKNLDECTDFQLKFVLNKNPVAWQEMEDFLDKLSIALSDTLGRSSVRDYVYIMPVGADNDSQYDIAGDVADMAVERGYKVSARVHAYLWNNPVGK